MLKIKHPSNTTISDRLLSYNQVIMSTDYTFSVQEIAD